MSINILGTQRLILRPLEESDSDDLFGVRSDPEVMAFWDAPPDATPSETASIVGLMLADARSGAARYWTIRLRVNESVIGVCDLSDLRADESADVGFMLLRRHWAVGLGRETLGCLLTYAKSTGLRVLTARIHRENARSLALLRRAGFRFLEELANYEIRSGVFRDCLRLEVTL